MNYAQQATDDCLTASVATLLGIEPYSLPSLDGLGEDWFGDYSARVVEATGYELLSLELNTWPRGRWIAQIAPPLPGTKGHAIVMHGDHVEWDPAREEPRTSVTPDDVEVCIVAVPLDPRKEQP